MVLKNILLQIPEVSFRVIPDEDGDSCTFLSWFLPTEELTRGIYLVRVEQNMKVESIRLVKE